MRRRRRRWSWARWACIRLCSRRGAGWMQARRMSRRQCWRCCWMFHLGRVLERCRKQRGRRKRRNDLKRQDQVWLLSSLLLRSWRTMCFLSAWKASNPSVNKRRKLPCPEQGTKQNQVEVFALNTCIKLKTSPRATRWSRCRAQSSRRTSSKTPATSRSAATSTRKTSSLRRLFHT